MLIYELLHNGGQNNLITRPRRFGKTLNFSMLKYFFDITEKENSYLFDGLKISEHYDELAVYKNTHPVITVSYTHLDVYKRQVIGICDDERECLEAAERLITDAAADADIDAELRRCV